MPPRNGARGMGFGGPPQRGGMGARSRFPELPAVQSQAGPLPIPASGVSPTRIMDAQLHPAEYTGGPGYEAGRPIPPPPPGSDPLLGTLLQAVQALRDEVVALRRERSTPDAANQGRGYAPPDQALDDGINFFSYLPPLYVRPWERWWFSDWNAAAALNVDQLIVGERVRENQVLIITNYQFYTTRAVAGANNVLMDPGETLSRAYFKLLADGHPLHETAAEAAGVSGRVVGDPLTQAGQANFQPQYAAYVRGGSLLEAFYARAFAMTVDPVRVVCWINGFTLPLTDFQRALSRGSLF